MAEDNAVINMSVLDTKQSHILNFPLTVKQQLWLIFILPPFFASIFYVIDIATDLAIGCALITEKHIWAGVVTLLLPYSAPLISYFTEICNPPPENELKVLIIWFLTETVAFVLFPLRPIQCFAERIFWSVEALRLEDPLREEALRAYEETKKFNIEQHFFFQGILHAGPQMLFQLILVILGTSNNPNTEMVQILCILSSLATVSMITVSYHRYESQVKGGRNEVWKRKDQETVDAAPELLLLNPPGLEIPKRRKWIKLMDEDDPMGKTIFFLFWFLFLLGRSVCLTMAAVFFPWAVLGVCLAHYILSLIYILLPSSSVDCKSPSIIIKILLAFVYIICLIEVGIQYKKSKLFYSLYFTFTLVENFSLTVLWAIWANWEGWWYLYSLYLMGITHFLAIVLLVIYMKFFQPEIKRIQPNNS